MSVQLVRIVDDLPGAFGELQADADREGLNIAAN